MKMMGEIVLSATEARSAKEIRKAETLAKFRVAAWNRDYAVPTFVRVKMDDGRTKDTKTRAEAQVLWGRAVIWLEGFSGCYALERVQALGTRLL